MLLAISPEQLFMAIRTPEVNARELRLGMFETIQAAIKGLTGYACNGLGLHGFRAGQKEILHPNSCYKDSEIGYALV